MGLIGKGMGEMKKEYLQGIKSYSFMDSKIVTKGKLKISYRSRDGGGEEPKEFQGV